MSTIFGTLFIFQVYVHLTPIHPLLSIFLHSSFQWVVKETKDDIKKEGRVDFAKYWSVSKHRSDYWDSRNVDVLAQKENLEKARLLLIEKSVLEILMRLESLTMEKGGIASFSDISRVHFANLTLEQEMIRKQAKIWLEAHPEENKRRSLSRKRGKSTPIMPYRVSEDYSQGSTKSLKKKNKYAVTTES